MSTPVAAVAADPAYGVLGTVVKLNGQRSYDLDADPYSSDLIYNWSFVSVPIGSRVSEEEFRQLDETGSLVSFSPDIVGEYVVGLTVSNGAQTSARDTVRVSVRALLVPHGRGLVPDGKWIWSYLRDVWQGVENKEWFETFWSALIQITGSELLKLYQNDFNKSIRDIQDLYQRRWLKYEPRLDLISDDVTFILGYHAAGTNASTPGSDHFTGTIVLPAGGYPGIRPGRILNVAGQSFRILRSVTKSGSLYVTIDGQVATGLVNQNWRIPHTLKSSSQNFEELGVFSGDLLVAEMVSSDGKTAIEVQLQVVGVSGNTLGFVLTNEPVSSGAVPDVPNDTYLSLSSGFGINAVTQSPDGTLSFSGLAKQVLAYLSTGVFQKAFWNVELTSQDQVTVQGLSFYLRPKRVIRNHAVPVDTSVMSVPVLQDWIVQPQWVERGGKFYQQVRGKDFPIPAPPAQLVENTDFIVDDENVQIGQATISTDTSSVHLSNGHFIDRGLRPGDLFTISAPAVLSGSYPIEAVASQNDLVLAKPVPSYTTQTALAELSFTRKRTGKFVRFVPGGFTAKSPAPDRLWAEVTYFDNSDSIEANFGLLVGLKKADLEEVSQNLNYRQAVAGLMYAYTQGSSINKVRLGAQILLGLPFAEHRGIVRSIEDDYRLDINGTPIEGRLLVEDVDSSNNPQGTLRVYLFPIAIASDLAGIETNPATNKPYTVGDIAELFAPLAKGVEIDDYLNSDPPTFSAVRQLQQFHSIRVRINNTVFTLQEIGLVSQFLQKITPSYVLATIAVSNEVADNVDVTDNLVLKFRAGTDVAPALTDQVSMSLPGALELDSALFDGKKQMYWDGSFYWMRRVGTDLMTTTGSFDVSSAAGGFLNPQANESFEAPLTRDGDYLILLSGPNRGIYPLSSITDTGATCSGGEGTGFAQATGQIFAIGRKMSSLLRSGTATTTSGSRAVVMEAGALQTDGVVPGDWLCMNNRRYMVTRVGPAPAFTDPYGLVASAAALPSGSVEIDTAPASTGTHPYVILRPHLLEYESPSPFSISVSTTESNIVDVSDPTMAGQADVGDMLEPVPPTGFRYVVLAPRMSGQQMYVTPPMPNSVSSVNIIREERGSPFVWGYDRFNPIDGVEVGLYSDLDEATCTADSASVTFASTNPILLGTRPGDLLQLTSGSNGSVDVGYGPGMYPIVGISASGVTLSENLQTGETDSFKILRRR